MRVLVVDDDEDLRNVVGRALTADGHQVDAADSVAGARAAIEGRQPHLVVLDLGLPDGSGLGLCRDLREEGHSFPILILTAKADVAVRVKGLDAGADDYLGKPFAVAELRARVRALARRLATTTKPMRASVLTRGDLVLDFTRREASRGGRMLPVTARQWSILEMLAAYDGKVVSRSTLLEQVWGEDTEAAAASLEVLVARLRKRLGANIIRTLRGEGYAFGSKG
ncbi:MAG: response regulator transcription factor [Deltaproteobacteria bacterium]|nr:response regulator transcription factor [Deltaproteobacteria bacterium]